MPLAGFLIFLLLGTFSHASSFRIHARMEGYAHVDESKQHIKNSQGVKRLKDLRLCETRKMMIGMDMQMRDGVTLSDDGRG